MILLERPKVTFIGHQQAESWYRDFDSRSETDRMLSDGQKPDSVEGFGPDR